MDFNINISPNPPLMESSISIPMNWIKNHLLTKLSGRSLRISGEAIAWCLNQVLSDQLTEGESAGAWSKRYAEFISAVYGKNKIPEDVSFRDTITYSAWNAESLIHFHRLLVTNHRSAREIELRLNLLHKYVLWHQDKSGGFGLHRYSSAGEKVIAVDLRHTCWGMQILWQLNPGDRETNEALNKVGAYLGNVVENIDLRKERPMSLAVIHRVISTPRASELILSSDSKRSKLLHEIEACLIEKFDEKLQRWVDDRNPPDRPYNDYFLIIARTLDLSRCVDDELIDIVVSQLQRMCELSVEGADIDELGLPFLDYGQPDVGTTLLLLYLLQKNLKIVRIKRKTREKLARFVTSESNRKKFSRFSFSWQLASGILLVEESTNLNVRTGPYKDTSSQISGLGIRDVKKMLSDIRDLSLVNLELLQNLSRVALQSSKLLEEIDSTLNNDLPDLRYDLRKWIALVEKSDLLSKEERETFLKELGEIMKLSSSAKIMLTVPLIPGFLQYRNELKIDTDWNKWLEKLSSLFKRR